MHTYLENECMYPAVRKLLPDLEHDVLESFEGLGRKQLQELGAVMVKLREDAPRRPSQPGAVRKVVDAVMS